MGHGYERNCGRGTGDSIAARHTLDQLGVCYTGRAAAPHLTMGATFLDFNAFLTKAQLKMNSTTHGKKQ